MQAPLTWTEPPPTPSNGKCNLQSARWTNKKKHSRNSEGEKQTQLGVVFGDALRCKSTERKRTQKQKRNESSHKRTRYCGSLWPLSSLSQSKKMAKMKGRGRRRRINGQHRKVRKIPEIEIETTFSFLFRLNMENGSNFA